MKKEGELNEDMPNSHPLIMIFDVDGVLLDSHAHLLAAVELMNDKQLMWNQNELKKIKPLDILRKFEASDSENMWQAWKNMNNNFRTLLPKRWYRVKFFYKIAIRIRKYERKWSDFFPSVVETLQELEKKGFILGLCSSAETKRTKEWLERKKLQTIIQCFIGRDTRKQFGVKPNPRPLYALLVQIKHQFHLGKIDLNRVAFVGDNCTDVLAAKNGKIKSIAVTSGHGYRDELLALNPDLLLTSMVEIPNHLTKLFSIINN
jgi:phosphoglycolate phosphatase